MAAVLSDRVNVPASERASTRAEMEQILDTPPTFADHDLRGGTRLTRPWTHGPLHATLPGLDTHVIMTYYGTAHQATWRQGSKRVESRTRRGSVTLIPEGEDGRWDVEGPIEVSHVYLPDWRLQSAAEAMAVPYRVELIGRNCFEDPTSAQIMEILGKEAMASDAGASLFVEQAVDLLCMQLIRSHSSFGAAQAAAPRRGLTDRQVRRVNDYMLGSLDRAIGLDELAGLVDLSRFHFATSFKLATGMTPHEWLTSLRMNRARELLARTDRPIIAIALEVGYETPSAFSAIFRKVAKITPSAYRREVLAR
ncbi:helix-turn-helix domain-containing protein [Xanthobacteraceae bacterium A53D]